jgi:hypothetical protein
MDAQGLGYSDAVSHLYHNSLAELIGYEVLRYPSGGIGSRTINLSGVFAGKSTSTVSSPASVSISNDLAACKSSISMGSSNNKQIARIENVTGVDKPSFRYGYLNNLIE